MTLENDFETRCTRIADDVEAALQRPVRRFRSMCAEHGAIETVRRFVNAPKPSATFAALLEQGRLDLTVEAVVATERQWNALFTDAERKAARQRLQDHDWPPAGEQDG